MLVASDIGMLILIIIIISIVNDVVLLVVEPSVAHRYEYLFLSKVSKIEMNVN